jgi:hypothetical protein
MAEESDSAVADEQVSEAPEEVNTFGMIEDDYSPDKSDETSEPSNEQTENTPKPITDADPDRQGGELRQADYTRKMQDHADNVRRWEAERADQQRVMDDQRSQLTQAASQPQYQPVLNTQADALSQAALDPSLSATERAGLNVLAETQRATEELRGQVAEFQRFRDELSPQFQQTQDTLAGFTQDRQDSRDSELRLQGEAAIGLFGEQAVSDNVAFIRQNIEMMNPRTNKTYTVSELVGMATGKVAEETQQARSNTRDEQGRFKSQAGTNGSTPHVEGTYSSQEDAMSEIANTLSNV